MNEPGGCLQITENKLTLLPPRIHLREANILETFERSPGENCPRAASASFSWTFGGVSF
jgi:hypothetical protein